jgi:lysozyme family protein
MHMQVGPATAAARRFADGQKALVDELIEANEQYETALASAPKFINGWTRRQAQKQQRACVVAGIA